MADVLESSSSQRVLCFLHDWQAWLAFGRRADVRFWAGASVDELAVPLRLRFIVVEERED